VPDSFSAVDKPWRVPGSSGGLTVAASALAMPVADALRWYEEAANGRVIIPRTEPPIALGAPPFGVEPALGRFCVGENVPFAAQWHGGSRIHRLVPMENPDEAVQDLGSSEDARKWLATNTGFDPFEDEEWLASLTLLAPDPLLWGVGHFTQSRGAGGQERVILQAHRRRYAGYPEADADALKLVLLQRRPPGWIEVLPTAFDEDGLSISEYPEPVSESGYGITCPTRGLLRLVSPQHWMEHVSVNFAWVNTVLNVEVPAGGRGKPTTQYVATRAIDGGAVEVGKALPPSGAIRIVQLQEARKRRIEMNSAPQRLFGAHSMDKEDLTNEELTAMRDQAETYVAGLVAGAHRRVIFVDPDFGVRELQNYAFRVMRNEVQVTILTSARRMRMPGGISEDAETPPLEPQHTLDPQTAAAPPAPHGLLLLAQLRDVQSKLGRDSVEVFVMPGSSKPLFHDRFLVIDDLVWSCGPSFNELGERVGLISRVHEPRLVITAIERGLKQSKSLVNWIAQSGLTNMEAARSDANV
jgi:hypothetical protein